MSSKASLKVVVLMGGPSSEYDVSLSSGAQCAAALRDEKFEVVEIVVARDGGYDWMQDLAREKADVVFNALHGQYGEDGCVQGVLELMGLPYTHSGVLASALAMDKQRSKETFAQAGLPVSKGMLCAKEDVQKQHALPPPYVIKPNNDGSSVGIYLVNEGDISPPHLAADMPETVMVEAFVPGRELAVAVLGDRALTVTDILTDVWYDYEAKYQDGKSRHVVPADLPAEIFDACLKYALRAHQVLGCRSVSRSDFRWDESKGLDGVVLLETNTQPGMTPTSLLPEQAAFCGVAFGPLCRQLVEEALCVQEAPLM